MVLVEIASPEINPRDIAATPPPHSCLPARHLLRAIAPGATLLLARDSTRHNFSWCPHTDLSTPTRDQSSLELAISISTATRLPLMSHQS
ncbi:uncharacterized protein CANTADRAFT_119341 [Suhomyces tanzawaensis NRRL Y-17324]|uniref:Uncharacterized protein n=1 Tax=Suhomyces tanzawaensis NRRL Y-17324 TaxID=984487 RepID=A0A1E4SQF2_9ASCO|nr:uncharacterized protein CANTADRAFT_119341 [Suhomyces tanzawaensis NRRL Y-17324]ODV81736.1 hypothetical protein CANTADRAFT_119341 [Suhomyces tanzawaensis NRRL Y-17324]